MALGLLCTKLHRVVEYTPVKCFEDFMQSAITSRRQGDGRPYSNVVAEIMKYTNTTYELRHIITKYTNDRMTHPSIMNIMFKRSGLINDQFYEVELAKFEIEH